MEMIVGRLTADAFVKPVKENKQVVVFNIAINDSYKAKGKERKQVTTYIGCSYWMQTEIAKHLTKGSIVSLYGRIDINAYETKDKEFKANLVFHVNDIKIISKAKKGPTAEAQEVGAENVDDLPF